MIEKSCATCGNLFDTENACRYCHANGYPKYEPSELYTAYLQEVEKNGKLQAALNCDECSGSGTVVGNQYTENGGCIYGRMPCPSCADIRKEAREA